MSFDKTNLHFTNFEGQEASAIFLILIMIEAELRTAADNIIMHRQSQVL